MRVYNPDFFLAVSRLAAPVDKVLHDLAEILDLALTSEAAATKTNAEAFNNAICLDIAIIDAIVV